MTRRTDSAGFTLMEVLVAVMLLSLLSVGVLMAMRVALGALGRANAKLMDNRRVAGAEQILQQELAGLIPVLARCGTEPDAPPLKLPFFEGQPRSMRFISAYSLQEAWRGLPQILEFQVIPGEDGRGVRLVVNEIPYTGAENAGRLCVSVEPDPATGVPVPRFLPIQVGPGSFVLADKLAFCRFVYLEAGLPPEPDRWRPDWAAPRWPLAIRIEMAQLDPDPSRIPMLTVTAPVHIYRSPEIQYGDY